MALLRLEIRNGRLHASGVFEECRPLTKADQRMLEQWTRQATIVGQRHRQGGRSALLEVGRALGSWLEGSAQWAARWLALSNLGFGGSAPELEIRVPFCDTEEHWALLDAPWELLALPEPSGETHEATFVAAWAAPLVVYRRLVRPGDPAIHALSSPTPRHALTVLFMAAAPEGQATLDHEVEERAILDATQELPLDLVVEETGTASELGLRLMALVGGGCNIEAAAPVQVVHLSCHGRLGQAPGEDAELLLEDEHGRPAPTTAKELARSLAGDAVPDLVVLSACLAAAGRRGGEPSSVSPPSEAPSQSIREQAVEPIALDLLRSFAPAVLGFADTVAGIEATCFSALLYRELAHGQTIEVAVAYVRQQMLTGVLRRTPLDGGDVARAGAGSPAPKPPAASTLERLLANVCRRGSCHWHSARLMLRPDGGGAIACPRAARRGLRRLPHAFLDVDRRMPVAGPERFVGRRRQLQEILRVLTAAEVSSDSTLLVRGVLIHGVGRLGKSSLAARVVERMTHHRAAVVVQDYSVRGVVNALRTALGPDAPNWLCAKKDLCWSSSSSAEVFDHETPDGLERGLYRLLVGLGRDSARGQPILLVLDDLESVLIEGVLIADDRPPSGRHRVVPGAAAILRAVLRAFGYAEATQSRLLVTSRFAFTLPDSDGTDLADVLWPLSLPAMTEHDARKQANAVGQTTVVGSLGERCIQLSLGNPGLLSVLLALAAEREQSCSQALEQMDALVQEGTAPSQDRLREFVERVAVEALLRLLSAAEGKLLRASMVFEVPVPITTIPPLKSALCLPDQTDWQRLIDLGVWEQHHDMEDPRLPAVIPSALVRPWVATDAAPEGAISAQERQVVARAVLSALANAWTFVANQDSSGATNGSNPPHIAPNPVNQSGRVGGGPGGFTPQGRGSACRPTETRARTPSGAIDRCSSAAFQVFTLALSAEDAAWTARAGGAGLEWLTRIGRTKEAMSHAASAMALLESRGGVAPIPMLRACIDLAAVSGDQPEADRWRRQALDRVTDSAEAETLDPADRAFVLLDHARVLENQGRTDEARTQLEQVLGLLGEERFANARSIALGDIARILELQGEPDKALQLQEQRLAMSDRHGDASARVLVLREVARILELRGDLARALEHHDERLALCEEQGDACERAIVLRDMARLYLYRGDIERGLRLHREALAIFEKRGYLREQAISLTNIAQFLECKGQADQALPMFEQALSVFKRLGDLRGQAIALGDVARTLALQGHVEQALSLQHERLAMFERLGATRERALALGDIARILMDKGQLDQALPMHQERASVFEKLGAVREWAIALADVARIHFEKGHSDDALRIFEQTLEVFDRIGDTRGRSVTMIHIARIRLGEGKTDQALALFQEALGHFERLGDARVRAITLAEIARIVRDQGEPDRALRLHQEALGVFESIGAVGERARALVDIAHITMDRDIDKAVQLLREAAAIFETLGEPMGRAVSLWSLGRLACRTEHVEQACEYLVEAHRIFLRLGQLEQSCSVGLELGKPLVAHGQMERALCVLESSYSGFMTLGQSERASEAKLLLQELGLESPAPTGAGARAGA